MLTANWLPGPVVLVGRLVAVAVARAVVGVAVASVRVVVWRGAALATSRVITPVSNPVAEQSARTNADMMKGALRLLLLPLTFSPLQQMTRAS
jgi:hypothetical protein